MRTSRLWSDPMSADGSAAASPNCRQTVSPFRETTFPGSSAGLRGSAGVLLMVPGVEVVAVERPGVEVGLEIGLAGAGQAGTVSAVVLTLAAVPAG